MSWHTRNKSICVECRGGQGAVFPQHSEFQVEIHTWVCAGDSASIGKPTAVTVTQIYSKAAFWHTFSLGHCLTTVMICKGASAPTIACSQGHWHQTNGEREGEMVRPGNKNSRGQIGGCRQEGRWEGSRKCGREKGWEGERGKWDKAKPFLKIKSSLTWWTDYKRICQA